MEKEKNIKGKEYDYYGNLEFEGEYLNGKKWNGKGKEKDLWNNGLVFEVDFNGKMIKKK